MSINKSKGGRKKNEVTDEIKEEAKEILDFCNCRIWVLACYW